MTSPHSLLYLGVECEEDSLSYLCPFHDSFDYLLTVLLIALICNSTADKRCAAGQPVSVRAPTAKQPAVHLRKQRFDPLRLAVQYRGEEFPDHPRGTSQLPFGWKFRAPPAHVGWRVQLARGSRLWWCAIRGVHGRQHCR